MEQKCAKSQIFYKKLAKNLFIQKNLLTFAPAFETEEHWRDGRVVDYSSLENYRAERHRGFESLSLRSLKKKPADFQRVSHFSPLEVPFEVPFYFYESLTSDFVIIGKTKGSRDILSVFIIFLMMYIPLFQIRILLIVLQH